MNMGPESVAFPKEFVLELDAIPCGLCEPIFDHAGIFGIPYKIPGAPVIYFVIQVRLQVRLIVDSPYTSFRS